MGLFKRMTGDIWDYLPTHAVVVPVNMQGVCGRGIARQMRDRWPRIETDLKARAVAREDAEVIRLTGKPHPVYVFVVETAGPDTPGGLIVTFPVKHHWRDKADLELIAQSCRELVRMSHSPKIAMPLVGCGFGELTEAKVMPVLEKELAAIADRILIVEPDEKTMKKYAESFKPGARQDRRTGNAPR